MASLTDPLKAFVVKELACYASPSAVRDSLEARGVSVTLDQVVYYDPTTKAKKKPAQKWIDLFGETRRRYNTELDEVAIASRRWRLDQLATIVRETRSPKLKMEAMEQAAKEVGDVYTNRRHVAHSGRIDWGSLTDDQLDQLADGKDPAQVLG